MFIWKSRVSAPRYLFASRLWYSRLNNKARVFHCSLVFSSNSRHSSPKSSFFGFNAEQHPALLPTGLPPLPSSAFPQLPAPPSFSTALASSDDSPLAWLLQSLSSDSRASAAGSFERVLVGQGLSTIPRSLLQKFAIGLGPELLLPTSTAQDNYQVDSPPAARFSLSPGCEVGGHRLT